ncbi:hypothetical protein Tco_0137306, partial [Tanacetum coccineum]
PRDESNGKRIGREPDHNHGQTLEEESVYDQIRICPKLMTPSVIVQDCPDCEDSQFCHSSRVSHLQLQLGIRYPNLID